MLLRLVSDDMLRCYVQLLRGVIYVQTQKCMIRNIADIALNCCCVCLSCGSVIYCVMLVSAFLFSLFFSRSCCEVKSLLFIVFIVYCLCCDVIV